jgi:hypothetical protein
MKKQTGWNLVKGVGQVVDSIVELPPPQTQDAKDGGEGGP